MNRVDFNDKVSEIIRINRFGSERCDSEFFHLKVIQILDKQEKISKLKIDGWNKYSRKSYSRVNRPDVNYENLVYLCFDMFQEFCKSNRYSLRLRWFDRNLYESRYMTSDVVFIFNYCEEYLRKLVGENVISKIDRNWLTSDLELYFNEQLRILALNTSGNSNKVIVHKKVEKEFISDGSVNSINKGLSSEDSSKAKMSKRYDERAFKYGMIDYDKKEFIFMVTEMLKKNINISMISLNTWNRYSRYKFGKFARENMELLELLIYSNMDKFADTFSRRYISLSSRWFGDGRDIRGMLYQDITFIYVLSEDYLRSKKGAARLSPTSATQISDMGFYLKENMNNIYSEFTGVEENSTSSIVRTQYNSKSKTKSLTTKNSLAKSTSSINESSNGKYSNSIATDSRSKSIVTKETNRNKVKSKEMDKELEDILSAIDDFIF